MNILKKIAQFAGVAVASFLLVTSASAKNADAAVLVIDPGHGGPGTSGAGCVYAPYMEKALTLAVATQLKDQLSGVPGLTVYMTRTSDVSLSLEQRAMYAKSVNADFMVSIHFNASGTHDKTGTEVWTSAFGEYFTRGYQMGQMFLTQYSNMGLQNKGVKTRLGDRGDYYGIIRNGVALGIPTIIVEHCFLDQAYDRSILESKGLGAFASADATAIKNYANAVGWSSGHTESKPAPVAAAAPVAAPAAKSGAGAAASTTKYGFPVDSAGNVTYRDPAGSSTVFTASEWSKLIGKWAYTSDPEYYLKSVPVGDLRAILAQ